MGLTAAITNALEPEIYRSILAGDLMMGRDPFGKRWNQNFRKTTAAKAAAPGAAPATAATPAPAAPTGR